MSLAMVPRTRHVVIPGGVPLAVDHFQNGAPDLVVISHGIFCHRRMEELVTLADHLAERFDVLLYDVRGHGDSGGRFSFGLREWRDLSALVALYAPGYRRVAGMGFSFGGFHTCLAAAKSGCFDAVSLVASPKSFNILDHNPFSEHLTATLRLGRQRRRRWTRLAYPMGRRTMPVQCIDAIRAPIHIVHGDADWLIHPKHAVVLHGRANGNATLDIVPGGLHAEYMIRQMPGRILPLLSDWLRGALAHTDEAPTTPR